MARGSSQASRWIEHVKSLEHRIDVRMDGLAAQIQNVHVQVETLLQTFGKVESTLALMQHQLAAKPTKEVIPGSRVCGLPEARLECSSRQHQGVETPTAAPPPRPTGTAAELSSVSTIAVSSQVGTVVSAVTPSPAEAAADKPPTRAVTAAPAQQSCIDFAASTADRQASTDDSANMLARRVHQPVPIDGTPNPAAGASEDSEGDSDGDSDVANALLADLEGASLDPDVESNPPCTDKADVCQEGCDLEQPTPDAVVESKLPPEEVSQEGASDDNSDVADALLADLQSVEGPAAGQPEISAEVIPGGKETCSETQCHGDASRLEVSAAVGVGVAVPPAAAGRLDASAVVAVGASVAAPPAEACRLEASAAVAVGASVAAPPAEAGRLEVSAAVGASVVVPPAEVESHQDIAEEEAPTKRPLPSGSSVSASKRKKMDWYKQKFPDANETIMTAPRSAGHGQRSAFGQLLHRSGQPGARRLRTGMPNDVFPLLPGTRQHGRAETTPRQIRPGVGLRHKDFLGTLPAVDTILPLLPMLEAAV